MRNADFHVLLPVRIVTNIFKHREIKCLIWCWLSLFHLAPITSLSNTHNYFCFTEKEMESLLGWVCDGLRRASAFPLQLHLRITWKAFLKCRFLDLCRSIRLEYLRVGPGIGIFKQKPLPRDSHLKPWLIIFVLICPTLLRYQILVPGPAAMSGGSSLLEIQNIGIFLDLYRMNLKKDL